MRTYLCLAIFLVFADASSVSAQSSNPSSSRTSTPKASASTVTASPSPCAEEDRHAGFCPCPGVNPKATPTPIARPTATPEATRPPTSTPSSSSSAKKSGTPARSVTPRVPTSTATNEPSLTPTTAPTNTTTPAGPPINCEDGVPEEPGCYFQGNPIPFYKRCREATRESRCVPEGEITLPENLADECIYDKTSGACIPSLGGTIGLFPADVEYNKDNCPQDFPSCSPASVPFESVTACGGCWRWSIRELESSPSDKEISCTGTETKNVEISFNCTLEENLGDDQGEAGYAILDKRCHNKNPSECDGSCDVRYLDPLNECRGVAIEDVQCGPPNPQE